MWFILLDTFVAHLIMPHATYVCMYFKKVFLIRIICFRFLTFTFTCAPAQFFIGAGCALHPTHCISQGAPQLVVYVPTCAYIVFIFCCLCCFAWFLRSILQQYFHVIPSYLCVSAFPSHHCCFSVLLVFVSLFCLQLFVFGLYFVMRARRVVAQSPDICVCMQLQSSATTRPFDSNSGRF